MYSREIEFHFAFFPFFFVFFFRGCKPGRVYTLFVLDLPVNVIITQQNAHFAGVCVVPVPVLDEAPVPAKIHIHETRDGIMY